MYRAIILFFTISLAFPLSAFAAIAFDTSTIGANGITPGAQTYYTFTAAAGDTAVCVANEGAVSGTDSTTNVQIGTAAGTSTMTREGGVQTPSDRYIDMYCINGTFSGVQTIQVSASISLTSLASAYSGTASIDAVVTGSSAAAASLTLTTTPTVVNAWVVSDARNAGRTTVAGTGTTVRQNPGEAIGDGNAAINPIAATSMQWSPSGGGSFTWGGVIVALEPVVVVVKIPSLLAITGGGKLSTKSGTLSIKP